MKKNQQEVFWGVKLREWSGACNHLPAHRSIWQWVPTAATASRKNWTAAEAEDCPHCYQTPKCIHFHVGNAPEQSSNPPYNQLAPSPCLHAAAHLHFASSSCMLLPRMGLTYQSLHTDTWGKNCMYVWEKKAYVCRQTKKTQWSILIKCWIYTSWFGIFFCLMLYAWWWVGWHRKKNTQDTFSMEEQWEFFYEKKF